MPRSELLSALRTNWRPVLVVHVFFSLAGLALLMPLFSLTLRSLLALSGRSAVADQDIAALLLTPGGLLGGVFLTALLLAILSLELGALLFVAAAAEQGQPLGPAAAITRALRRAPQLLLFTTLLTARVLAYLAPFLLAVWLIATWLLKDHDINYYLAEHPPQFIAAVALGAVCTVLLCWFLGRRLLDWSLALPLTLFGEVAPRASFAASSALTAEAGSRPDIVRRLLGWLLLALLLSSLPALLLAAGAGALIDAVGDTLSMLVPLLGVTVVLTLGVNLLTSALVLGALAFVIVRLYFENAGPAAPVAEPTPQDSAGQRGWTTTGIVTAALVTTGLAVGAGLFLLHGLPLEDRTLVVAHRGAAGAAPENTLAAIERAIADGADWVEIDVQESRDGEVVVIHDSDFMKLAGEPLKVWEGSLEEIRQIDVGSWFGPEFSDQRVATLREVLATVRGRSKLVVELKYYGHDVNLEQRVIDIIEAEQMAEDVVLMSLKLPAVQKAKALRPDWTVGLLAATAVGDLTRLDVDFLAVSASIASRGFIRRARRAGKPVFVWTVNDTVSLSEWISHGVAGVITDEPALARQVLVQRAGLTPGERLLLSAASWLGKAEAPGVYRDDSP